MLLQSETEMDFPACMRAMNRWDAGHYIQLVEQGYAGYMEDGQHLFLVFFPAYVWVVRLVRLLVPDTAAAGMLVSTLCYAWGCCWVYRLAAACFGGRVAADAVRLLSLYPFSFFFGTVMTEGLFLLTSSAACFIPETPRIKGRRSVSAPGRRARMKLWRTQPGSM